MTAASDLEQGRQSFAHHAWKDAFTRLSAVDNASPLEPEDIERLGISAYLIGNESDSLEMLARAHREWLKRDHIERAAQSAFWLGFVLLQKGQRAQGNGWIARSRRLLDEGQRDCVVRGYLLLPAALQHVAERDLAAAHDTFAQAARIGERFGDPDLVALARQGQGRALIGLGRYRRGRGAAGRGHGRRHHGRASSPIIVGTSTAA